VVLGVLDLVRRGELEPPPPRCADPCRGGLEQLVRRLVEVEVRLVLLVLVEVDGACGDDGGEAQRDGDDDLEAALPGPGGGA
jgi:hypothetical protein